MADPDVIGWLREALISPVPGNFSLTHQQARVLLSQIDTQVTRIADLEKCLGLENARAEKAEAELAGLREAADRPMWI